MRTELLCAHIGALHPSRLAPMGNEQIPTTLPPVLINLNILNMFVLELLTKPNLPSLLKLVTY